MELGLILRVGPTSVQANADVIKAFRPPTALNA
jgi:hypothetical protein